MKSPRTKRKGGGDNNGKSEQRFGSVAVEVPVHERRVDGTRHRRQDHVWFLGNRRSCTRLGVELEALVLVFCSEHAGARHSRPGES